MSNLLFDLETPIIESQPKINGLTYIPNYIDDKYHDRLLTVINEMPWRDDLKRRVQHYGYIYDYRSRGINKEMFLGDLPLFCDYFAEKFLEDKFFESKPDQVIINEYKAGQGIAAHVDCEPCFEDTVISMSLGSSCVMSFTSVDNPKIKIEQVLQPKSIVILKEDARYQWKHGISAKKSDMINGQKVNRGTRISLTFRKVIL